MARVPARTVPLRRVGAVVVAAFLLLASACSGSGDDGDGASADPSPTPPTTGRPVPSADLLGRFDDPGWDLELATNGEDEAWLLATQIDVGDEDRGIPDRAIGAQVWARDLDQQRWTRLPDPPAPDNWRFSALRIGPNGPVAVFDGCQRRPTGGCTDPDPRVSVVRWVPRTASWAEPLRFRLGTGTLDFNPVVAGDHLWLALRRDEVATDEDGPGTALGGVPVTDEEADGADILRRTAPLDTRLACATRGGDLLATGPITSSGAPPPPGPAGDPSSPPTTGGSPSADPPTTPLRRIDPGADQTTTIADIAAINALICVGDTAIAVPPDTGQLVGFDLAEGTRSALDGPDVPPGGQVVASRGSPIPAIVAGPPGALSAWIPLDDGHRWQRLQVGADTGTHTAAVTKDRFLGITSDRAFIEIPR